MKRIEAMRKGYQPTHAPKDDQVSRLQNSLLEYLFDMSPWVVLVFRRVVDGPVYAIDNMGGIYLIPKGIVPAFDGMTPAEALQELLLLDEGYIEIANWLLEDT